MVLRLAVAAVLLVLFGHYVPDQMRERFDLFGLRFFLAAVVVLLAAEAAYRLLLVVGKSRARKTKVVHVHHHSPRPPVEPDAADDTPGGVRHERQPKRWNSPHDPRVPRPGERP